MENSANSTRRRVHELLAMGYQCSQVIMILGLEARGQTNPGLIKAMAGLSWGCGDGSCTCGCLTGACCLLSLESGPALRYQEQQKRRTDLSTELVRWFWFKYGFPLSGIDCMAIREAEGPCTPSERCRDIIESVYQKVREIIIINTLDSEWDHRSPN